MKTRRTLPLAVVALAAALGVTSAAAGAEPVNGPKTALDEYIAKPDPAYAWKVVKTIPGDGHTTFVVDLTSQRWRSVPEVDRDLWRHWLVIVKPNTVRHDTAFLTIGGGRNGSPAPDGPSPVS